MGTDSEDVGNTGGDGSPPSTLPRPPGTHLVRKDRGPDTHGPFSADRCDPISRTFNSPTGLTGKNIVLLPNLLHSRPLDTGTFWFRPLQHR